eukprot:4009902-Pyramimonas_sp.AAC.1
MQRVRLSGPSRLKHPHKSGLREGGGRREEGSDPNSTFDYSSVVELFLWRGLGELVPMEEELVLTRERDSFVSSTCSSKGSRA